MDARYVSLKAKNLCLIDQNNALSLEVETLKRKLAEKENIISAFKAKAKEVEAKADQARSEFSEAIKAHSEDVERLTKSYEIEKEKLTNKHRVELRALLEKHVSVMKQAQEDQNI